MPSKCLIRLSFSSKYVSFVRASRPSILVIKLERRHRDCGGKTRPSRILPTAANVQQAKRCTCRLVMPSNPVKTVTFLPAVPIIVSSCGNIRRTVGETGDTESGDRAASHLCCWVELSGLRWRAVTLRIVIITRLRDRKRLQHRVSHGIGGRFSGHRFAVAFPHTL